MAKHLRLLAALAVLAVLHSVCPPAAPAQDLAPRPISWTSIGPDGLGPVSDLAIHPADPSIIFAASPGGGLWKSTDAGTTWIAIDGLSDTIITRIVFDPAAPSTIYAIAQASASDSFVLSDRLLTSTDGGTTWASGAFAGLSPVHVSALAVSSDGSTLLAATSQGLLRSRDRGASWVEVWDRSVNQVAFLPGSTTDIVAAYRGNWYAPYAYWSADGGDTWTASNGSTTSGYAAACTGPFSSSLSARNVVYAVDACSNVHKSVNGGRSFTWLGTLPLYAPTAASFALWVDPTDSQHVIVGGSDLWRTIDGGETWTRISTSEDWPRSAPPGYYAIVSDPGYNGATNRRVYFATALGVYKIDDVAAAAEGTGGAFVALNSGLRVSRFSHAALDPRTGKIAATLDRGTALLDPLGGDPVWLGPIGDSLGAPVAVDPRTPGYVYSEDRGWGWGIHRTNLGSGNTEYIDGWTSTGCKPAPYRINDDGTFCGIYHGGGSGPFVLDPNDPNTMLVGGMQLWRTTDVTTSNTPTTGPTWSALTERREFALIEQIAVAPGNSNIIWLGYGSTTELFATRDGTSAHPTWTAVAFPPTKNREVSRIVFDPDDPNTVYLTFRSLAYTTGLGFSLERDNVWKTSDSGATWVNASGTGTAQLPAESVESLIVHPLATNVLYAGTSRGVFQSTDGGATWSATSPATVQVNELLWQGTDLIAATYGRGLFKAQTRHALLGIDRPTNLRTLAQPFAIAGWSIDQASPADTGISEVSLTAYPESGGAPIPLGTASYGGRRDDVGAAFGAQFTPSGYSLTVNGLAPGRYRLAVSARSTFTGQYEAERSLTLTLVTPTSGPRGSIDVPAAGATVGPRFRVAGWVLESGSTMDAGIDAVHVYAYPAGGGAVVFLGVASYGAPRPDVAAVYGEQFANPGFDLLASDLPPGGYRIVVFYRSTLTGQFAAVTQDVTVRPAGDPVIFVDTPADSAVVIAPFEVAGWALHRDAATGAGIDAIHIYAFPSGGGSPTFLGVGTYGVARPDVGAAFGAQFVNSGYTLAGSLPPGTYTIVVYARSSVTGVFSSAARSVTVRPRDPVVATRAALAAGAPGAPTGSWLPFGPATFGGPVSAISPDPADPNVLVIGTLSGIWRAADGGANWAHTADQMGSVRTLVRRPAEPRRLFAAGTAAGVFQSTDGGQTWSQLPSGPVSVTRLAFNADGTLLAAVDADGRLFLSADLGTSWVPASPYVGWVHEIVFSPVHPGTWFMAYTIYTNSVFHFLDLTTDGGLTYQRVRGGSFDRLHRGMVWSRSDPSIAYAFVNGEVRRSTDGGASFSTVSVLSGITTTTPLWVDPTNSQIVWVGGRRREVWRSDNGGRTFRRISLAAEGAPSGPILTIAEDAGFNGATNRRVYFGTAGGVFRTDDIYAVSATSPWTALNNGLDIGSLVSGAASVGGGAIAVVTVNDEILRYDARTRAWARSYRPSIEVSADVLNGRRIEWDPLDSARVYAASERSELLRSTDDGASFEALPGPYGDCLDYCTPTYSPSLVLAKTNSHLLLLRGADRLVGTLDARADRPEWFTVRPWSTKSIPAPYAVGIDPTNADAVWVAGFYSGNEINRTSTGPGSAPPWPVVSQTYATRFVFDPRAPQTVYALPSLARTRDNGAIWTQLSAPPGGIFDLAIHPLDSQWMFLATSHGVYESRTGGTAWTISTTADVAVSELFWYGRTLVAVTRGRGLLMNDLSTGDSFNRQITAIETPGDGDTGPTPLRLAGWAVDLDAPTGVGVDAVHVWAFPASGAPVFLGATSPGRANADAAALFGSRFLGSGFELVAEDLPAGRYVIVAYARSAATGQFTGSRGISYTVTGPGAPAMSLDTPAPGAVVRGGMFVQGWALDGRADSGTGVDAIHVWAFPAGGGSPVFLGVAPYGAARADVGAIFGSRFTNSGYNVIVSGLPPGTYQIAVYAHSSVTGTFNQSRAVTVTVQ